MHEVEKFFFVNFQILGPLGCQGWVVIPQNVKKSQNHCTLRNSFPPFEDLKIPDMLFTSPNIPHITHGNKQCLLGVYNTKKRGDLYIPLD